MNRRKRTLGPLSLLGAPLVGAVLLAAPPEAAAAPTQAVVPRTATSALLATLHPTLARGSRPEARYDADDNAAIDLFNGNLSLNVPLGGVYRLDSQLSLALSLSYNSQVWDFATVSGATQGTPLVYSNAGLGFDLSLGRLVPPASATNPTGRWLYVSQDGGQHLFYSDLHHDTPDPGDTGDVTQYTRDSSYLRLRHFGSNTKFVDQGNGLVREFSLEQGEWRLTSLSSQAGSAVTIRYAADGLSWTLADNFGRVWKVYFQNSVDPSGVAWRLVDRVEVPAFGGQIATYDLSYTFAGVGRACVDSRGGTTMVPLLTSVSDPVGRSHGFEYNTTSSDCHDNGRVKVMKLTSGGKYGFDYGAYNHPAASCQSASPAHFVLGSGVVRKQKLQPDNTVVGTWTYAPELDAAAGGGCGFDARRTLVTTPLGDQHVYHFAVGTDAPSAGGAGLFALPFAPTRPHASGQLWLSEEIFDCEPGGTVCTLQRSRWARWDQDQLCGSTTGNCFDTNRRHGRFQEVFEDDTPLAGVKRFRDMAFFNFDGLGHYRTRIQSSNFGKADLLTTVRATNSEAGIYPPGSLNEGGTPGFYSVPSPSQPWFLEDYTYATVTDETGASVRTDACFSAEGWLLRTRRRADAAVWSAHDVVQVFVWENGEVVEEASLGADLTPLATTGSLCGLPLPAERFAVEREYQFGALAKETVLDELGAPLPYSTIDRTIDLNTGKTVVSRAMNGLATTYVYDLAGRPTWEQPEEGAWTQWVYSLPTGASTWNAGPKVIGYERPNAGGTPLRTRTVLRDTFDRLTGDWISMPAGALSGTRYQYNALNWKTHESTAYAPGTGGTIFWTQYLNHDPLGRPRTVRPPEGAAHDEVIEYRGAREEIRTIQVGRYYNPVSQACSESPATTMRTYDGLGRVWIEVVDRPQPLPGWVSRTETQYAVTGGVSSELRRETVREVSRGNLVERLFDGRGFLLSTSTRNLGGTVSGVITKGEYDARGLSHYELRTGDFLPATGLAVRTSYDALGRELVVAAADEPSKIWKEFSYGDENLVTDAGPDRRKSRLVRAVRHNYFEGAHHTVAEDYAYLGLGGRRSSKTFTVATVSSPNLELRMDKSYRTTVSYDPLGKVIRLEYPKCQLCSPGELTGAGVVLPTYDQGLLTALGGSREGVAENWLSQVTYGANRQPVDVFHANGARDHYEPDPFRVPRSSAIEVTLRSVSESSGTIVYDGEGATCGRGDRSFVQPPPDLNPEPESPGLCEQAVEVDPFGKRSGATRDPLCLGESQPSYHLFDAFDREVATLSRSALRQVTVNGVAYWQSDPSKYTRRWWLIGFGDELLAEVEDHVTLGFQTRRDMVHALGRVVGTASKLPASSTHWQAHKHPLGVRNSRPDGIQWNTEF